MINHVYCNLVYSLYSNSHGHMLRSLKSYTATVSGWYLLVLGPVSFTRGFCRAVRRLDSDLTAQSLNCFVGLEWRRYKMSRCFVCFVCFVLSVWNGEVIKCPGENAANWVLPLSSRGGRKETGKSKYKVKTIPLHLFVLFSFVCLGSESLHVHIWLWYFGTVHQL